MNHSITEKSIVYISKFIGWAIALIAITRLLLVTRHSSWTAFISKWGERKCAVFPILFTWIINLSWYMPKYFEEATYKLNNFSGFCDTVQDGSRGINSKYSKFINYPHFIITFLLITISYVLIGIFIFKSAKSTRQIIGQSSEDNYQKMIKSRNMKISR